MPLTPDSITVDPTGHSTAVTIKNVYGDNAVTYSSLNGSSAVTFPNTITTPTTYYLTNAGDYTVSATVSDVEVGPSSPVTARWGVPARVRTPVDIDSLVGTGTGGSMPEPWALDRAEYQSATLELNSGDKITWQIHGVDWGFTPLNLTNPQSPTIVTGGIYAISAWAAAYPAQPGKFGQLGLKLDDSNFGWHVFADAPLDGTDSNYATGAMQASATVYLPAGAVVRTPVWHDVGAPAAFNGQMIVQLIQAETTPDPGYDV